jgi:TRAP-type mannitol/chloroaromatic compound transport system permease small subunit
MEAVLSSLSEAHALVISSEPEGYGALLGMCLGIFYVSVVIIAVGAVNAVIRRDVWAFIRPIEGISKFFGYFSACIIPLLAVLIAYEVISRYAFQAPTAWAFEISYMLMGTCFLLAIAFCMQLRRHIRVDFLYDNVSPKKRATIDFVGYVFFLLPMVLWCSWGLWVYFLEAYKVNEVSGESAWNPIIWPFKFTFAFGFYLLGIQTVAEICKCVLVMMGRDVPGPDAVGGFK